MQSHKPMTVLVEERENAIEDICRDVEEIHDLFCQMAALTAEQSLLTDSIETHIDQAVRSTHEGVQHLAQADRYHEQATSTCLLS